jgi:hypothetical protein
MNNIDERIAELRAAMLPLQRLYGLKSQTIQERYQQICAQKQQQKRPKLQLPKL